MGPVILAPELIAEMTQDELDEYEAYLNAEAEASEVVAEQLTWRDIARPEQLPPEGDWTTWYIRGGRGGGKTKTGSNTLAELITSSPPGEWGVVAPTYGDARDTCIESSDSGLLTALGLPRSFTGWNRSMGELRLPDGSVVYADGADDGALRMQGKNLRGVWCDEIGLWKQWQTAWGESIKFAVRKAPGKKIVTGTPKRNMPAIKLVRQLMADERVAKTLLRTVDNAANLHPDALDDLMLLAGTALGMQELEGAVLDDDNGGYFRASDWRYWSTPDDGHVLVVDGIEVLLDRCARFITIDPAASVRTSADFMVATAWAITPRGEMLALDRVRGRVTEDDHADFIAPLRMRWLNRWDVVHLESTMQSSTLAHQLGRDGVPMSPLRADKDKVTRAIPYSRMQRQHRVFLPEGAEWLTEWVDEHEEFPNPNVHDDQVDTGSYAARVATDHWIQPQGDHELDAQRVADLNAAASEIDFETAIW